MAQRVEVQLIDDIDGESEAEHTYTFAINGAEYVIDLTESHADQFLSVLNPWVEAGRRVGGKRRGGTGKNAAPAAPAKPQTASAAIRAHVKEQSKPVDNATIRSWALDTGVKVGVRGALPKSVIDAYRQAHR